MYTTAPSKQNVDASSFHPDTRIIVAIDFGTTHSGFATAHIDDKVIEIFRNWKDQPTFYSKTLTSINYANGKKASWGYTARRDRKVGNNQYYERFKLYLDKKVAPTLPALPPGYTPLDIISDYLSSLYEHFQQTMHNRFGDMYGPHNFSWILTVPAMWDEEAKQAMTKAALQVGLVSAVDIHDKRKFALVLEPEAAAMQCCEQAGQANLKSGDKFIIVDAGGGTVDLTAYRIAQEADTKIESLRELCEGLGATCGSTFIDKNFISKLKSICGEAVIDQFQEQNPLEWVNLVQTWEVTKRQFVGVGDSMQLIQLPRALLKKLTPAKRQSLEDDYDGNIELTSDDMMKLFDPIVEEILELIRTQISRCQVKLQVYEKIDKIFLVGGFAASDYLFKKIEQTFPNIRVIRPVDPGSAVMSGAVLCGLNPRFIKARCARFTYGVNVSGDWLPENPGGKEVEVYNEIAGKMYATNLFHAMVQKGQEIGIDDHVIEQFIPTERDQSYGKMEFYQSDQINQKYMVSTMRNIGKLIIPMFTSASEEGIEGYIPVRVNIVQDVSSSMEGGKLTACKQGIAGICEILKTKDEVGLISFETEITIHSDIGSAVSSAEVIQRQSNSLEAGGGTALWDGIIAGHRTLKNAITRKGNHRNVLIVMTDGGEISSKAKFANVRNIIENHEIPNFLFIFAYAGESNKELISLCESPACSSYCKVIRVEDSKPGVAAAYTAIRQDLQLFRKSNSLGNKVVILRLIFGESMIKAEAINEGTGERRWCEFAFKSS